MMLQSIHLSTCSLSLVGRPSQSQLAVIGRHHCSSSSSLSFQRPLPFQTRMVVAAQATERFQSSAAEDVSQEDDGPIELSDDQDPFAALNSGGTSPIQSAISILFTGTLTVFLFRSLRRRAKQSKETKFRSSGLEKVDEKGTPAKEAESAKDVSNLRPTPTAIGSLQGAIIAGGFAYILYNFATYVDAGFAVKPVSTVYTVRQLTITIRTIITGLCYLATFVFAANSIGLGLYSIQLALNWGITEPEKVGSDNIIADPKTIETKFQTEAEDESQP